MDNDTNVPKPSSGVKPKRPLPKEPPPPEILEQRMRETNMLNSSQTTTNTTTYSSSSTVPNNSTVTMGSSNTNAMDTATQSSAMNDNTRNTTTNNISKANNSSSTAATTGSTTTTTATNTTTASSSSSSSGNDLSIAQAALESYGVPESYAGRYTLVRLIGKGAYGAVYVALERPPPGSTPSVAPKKVAIKHIINAFVSPTDARRIYREIKVSAHFSHVNIVALSEVIKPRDSTGFTHIYLVSELMETDLHRVIHSRQDLTSDHISYFIYQTLCALKHIHLAGVLHRDLKPSNLLVNADCTVKMCDFGLARESDSTLSAALTEYVVTRWYRAPEVLLSGGRYTQAIDVWSVGCILGELLLRRPLFPGENYLHQLQLITEILGSPTEDDLHFVKTQAARSFMLRLPPSDGVPFASLFPHVRGPVLDLLRKMLAFDPNKRYTVEECLAHPFLARVRAARRHVNEDVPPPRPFRMRVQGGSAALRSMPVEAIKARFYAELCGMPLTPTPTSSPSGGLSFLAPTLVSGNTNSANTIAHVNPSSTETTTTASTTTMISSHIPAPPPPRQNTFGMPAPPPSNTNGYPVSGTGPVNNGPARVPTVPTSYTNPNPSNTIRNLPNSSVGMVNNKVTLPSQTNPSNTKNLNDDNPFGDEDDSDFDDDEDLYEDEDDDDDIEDFDDDGPDNNINNNNRSSYGKASSPAVRITSSRNTNNDIDASSASGSSVTGPTSQVSKASQSRIRNRDDLRADALQSSSLTSPATPQAKKTATAYSGMFNSSPKGNSTNNNVTMDSSASATTIKANNRNQAEEFIATYGSPSHGNVSTTTTGTKGGGVPFIPGVPTATVMAMLQNNKQQSPIPSISSSTVSQSNRSTVNNGSYTRNGTGMASLIRAVSPISSPSSSSADGTPLSSPANNGTGVTNAGFFPPTRDASAGKGINAYTYGSGPGYTNTGPSVNNATATTTNISSSRSNRPTTEAETEVAYMRAVAGMGALNTGPPVTSTSFNPSNTSSERAMLMTIARNAAATNQLLGGRPVSPVTMNSNTTTTFSPGNNNNSNTASPLNSNRRTGNPTANLTASPPPSRGSSTQNNGSNVTSTTSLTSSSTGNNNGFSIYNNITGINMNPGTTGNSSTSSSVSSTTGATRRSTIGQAGANALGLPFK